MKINYQKTNKYYESRRDRKRKKDLLRKEGKVLGADVYYDGIAYQNCDQCGGLMRWCTCCEMFSRSCCVDYGTCQCS